MSTATDAAELLAQDGEPVVLSFVVGEQRDDATGEITSPGTPTHLTGNGYPSRYQKHEVDGETVRADDTRLILEVPALGQRPQVGWSALVDNVTMRVMSVRPIREAGIDVLYICQLRRQ